MPGSRVRCLGQPISYAPNAQEHRFSGNHTNLLWKGARRPTSSHEAVPASRGH